MAGGGGEVRNNGKRSVAVLDAPPDIREKILY